MNEENINNNENLYLQLSENEKKFEEIIKQQEIEKNSQLKSKNTDFEHAISEKEKEILSLTNNHVQITNDKVYYISLVFVLYGINGFICITCAYFYL